MKKIILFFMFFLCAKSFAQTKGITYQALILNPSEGKVSSATNVNSPLVSKNICMLFKFVDEFSNVEYQEFIRTKTDPYGMVNLIIGSGTQTAGYSTSFEKISWDSLEKNLVVGISFSGDCSSFTEISNQPFSSVPFAYSSLNAVNVTGVVALENGGTNATTIVGAKTNLRLENVDNTTDFNKPISTATAIALNLKEDTINKSTNVTLDGNSDNKYPTVKSVKKYVDSSVSFNLSGLTNEISRATLAENTIAANLSTEVNRATTAEATKEDAVNKSTDGTFTSNSDVKFPTEKATKTYVDASASSNSLALTNEISRATLAENTIVSNLATETERATLVETTLATNLTAEVTRATAAEATKEDVSNKSTDGSFTSNSDVKFPTEKATKTYVDASSSSNSVALTNEISRATLAENTITSNLLSETERATLAETTNATAIASEANRATLAETTLATNLNAEVNRATSAEATKEDSSNKSTDGSFGSNSDVKFPTEKATKTYVDASSSSNSVALTNEISRATLAENTIATNLVSETERATLAETTNTTAITSEANRATLAETTLATNLSIEVNRATVAEATKEDIANKSTDGSFTSNSDVKFPTEKATKTYVDASSSSNSLALTNEISRATLAENTIATNLVSETERATLAESTNATAITSEANRATLAETTLTTNLTAEVNRATTAEATKEDALNKSTDGSFTSNSDVKFPTEKATKTYVDASSSSNSLALTNEISRATLAENAIASNLVSETERATLAESTNTTAIASEVNRATLAETTLATNLSAEVNRATTAEATKEDAVNKSTDGSFTSNSDVKFPTEKATKTYVDASSSSNSLALTNEISRATLAENAIASNLVSETERATLAETTNTTAIASEVNRATLAETTLATNLSTEVNRATTAEATKEDAVNKSTDGTFTSNSDVKFPTEKATKTYVDASASSNSVALTNEISRATLAENTIASNLVSETERATLAEANNATAITSEVNRATLAETTLATNLSTEVNRATTAEATKEDAVNKSTDGTFTSNSDLKFPTVKATKTYVDASASSNSLALTNEISRATLAENTIATNLVSETERATLAESTNATAITSEANRATLAETTLATNLNAEVNRATSAEATKEDSSNKSTDGSFASNSDVKFPTEKATKTYVDASASSNSLALTNEISRATLAENTIASNLATETERATLAETTNATAITSEVNRAILAETTLATNLSTEVNRATAVEATKEDAVNKSTDGTFTSNSDVKFPTEKATKTYVDASSSSNSVALTNEISRATLAENAIASNLVSETERATLAEANNATAITSEVNRATLAETTLATNLSTEVNRATTAEATKEDAVNKSTDGTFTSNSDLKFPTEKATKTYVDASSSSNSVALTNEISRATLAENTIASNLVSETERATLAETTNTTAITSEVNRAILAETTLATNLTAEVTRATAAEATKEDTANKSTDGSFTSNSDVKFPTEKATKTYVDASASSNSVALTNEISRATLAENTIASNLVSETERATLAETTLATNLTAEVTRATAAEATKEDASNKSTDGSFTSNSDVKFPTEKATKTYVDASASSNSLALTNEISRATLAENTIAANLLSETERATLAEANNATAITSEVNRATLAETTLATNLSTEVNRATVAEATKEDTANKSTDGSFTSNSDVKFPTEKATKTYVDASSSSNSLALTNEISRATLAENTITSNLVSETERATSAETTNATAITSETNRATLAETILVTNLSTEVNRATTAEATKEDAVNKSTDGSFNSNSDVKFPTEKATKTYVDASASSNSLALTNEISRATLAENTIAANLLSETERATLAEANNATAITSEVNRATLAETTLATNLSTEVNRATVAEATKEDTANKSTDGSFTSNSDVKFPTEKATKTYVDASSSSNSVALTNEISRATLAENTIASNLVSETERATLAETTLATNLTAEVTRATAAEATKEDASNKSTDGSFTSNSDVKFPTEKATKTYVDGTTVTASTALTTEINRATTAENTITVNLVAETNRATSAETTLATNLTTSISMFHALLDLKASVESPTFTGTVSGVTAAMVGLENVNNTSDADKPVSAATQTALETKANLESPHLTGTPLALTAIAGTNTTQIATTEFVTDAITTVSTNTSTNFVNLTTNQTIAGTKNFTSDATINGVTVGRGKFNENSNTAVGLGALEANAGYANTGIGRGALALNDSGNGNTALGYIALSNSKSGVDNVSIGGSSLLKNISGSQNTAIGNRADVASDGITNSVAIGANAIVTASNTIQLGSDGSGSQTAVTNVNTSAIITAIGYKIPSGTASQYLMANGTISTGAIPLQEIADEFTATESVINFILSQTPSVNSKVKMYVNGIRISNAAYSWTGTALTYIPANNGSYSLSVNDRIQFDYFY
ncbi:beta strand repeat-containing protein [Flavobacterium sandaracinum]|uniref:T9SS type A sorting domain-containing protein n=1 Tax=Flavobacterium sandaracinum TaxID=2541733 RepID=A0A4R5D6G8_9FLAO|nr:hypothetical protein [Flavobacterium sandaracinum]TDE07231.1 hypothetical protein E0F91_02775 [Flavobacterium sandaracinum]